MGSGTAHTARRRIQHPPDNSGGNMRIPNCYMANDSKGHFVTAKQRSTTARTFCAVCPVDAR
uniref:putative zinc ribbon protein n=1 Tax=Escherichia coli TaxID=562 RepID=UPI0035B2E3B9